MTVFKDNVYKVIEKMFLNGMIINSKIARNEVFSLSGKKLELLKVRQRQFWVALSLSILFFLRISFHIYRYFACMYVNVCSAYGGQRRHWFPWKYRWL